MDPPMRKNSILTLLLFFSCGEGGIQIVSGIDRRYVWDKDSSLKARAVKGPSLSIFPLHQTKLELLSLFPSSLSHLLSLPEERVR
jgi:hypothetical protein